MNGAQPLTSQAIDAALPGNLRVLLVDEREVLRNGLKASLASEPGIEVVGTAAGFPEALTLAVRTCPQLVVSDLEVAGVPVTALFSGLKALASAARVLILTGQAGEAQLRSAMMAGARGYLLKDDGYSDLLEALRVVGAGRRFFSDTVESRILTQYTRRLVARQAATDTPLTPREREVLACIGAGHSNKAIARALQLSVKTAEKHRSNLMRKLGLHNAAAVTAYAIRLGLVDRTDS